jgi:hypothetical protein
MGSFRSLAAVACGAALIAGGATGASAAPKADPLTQARTFYNQRKFEDAIKSADQARALPRARADSADLIAARAYLERFRESTAADDLTNGRDRLRRLDPRNLSPRERSELIVGLGEALFFDGSYGAAADIFDSALAPASLVDPASKDTLLDWWATALDRDARSRADADRQQRYQRIRKRMAFELGERPGSAAASYWLVAAMRGAGDLQAAWDAAEAAWVRAPLAPDHGVALRADIDRLVLTGIVPPRSKTTAQPVDQLMKDWQDFKNKWAK